MDLTALLRELVTLFVVIDPIGSLPVFYFATASVPAALHWKFALRAVIVAWVVLMAFLVGGQILLEGLGLRFGSFQIAGGVILFLFALTMIFGTAGAPNDPDGFDASASPAIFPLAVPSLASPGAMLAIVLLTDNYRFSIPEQAVTWGIMLSVILAALLCMLAAQPILRVIRKSGAAIVSRVMGMILAAVAVDNVIEAIIILIREQSLPVAG